MRTTVLLVLVAVHYARTEPVTSRSKQKTPAGGKRELEEGNVFGKRAPVLATVSPSVSPGIEYADTKAAPPDKSPLQEYQGVPQIGKISDVLTGQGPFQAAIAGHLYSPVSVYQQRVPTQTYEVGPPVPSQLAYSEHRVSIPDFNQYNLPQKQQQLPQPQQVPIYNQKQNFDQPQFHQLQQLQQLLQQIPNNHFLQPLQYNQQPALQQAQQPALQFPQHLQFQQIPSQPNIVFNHNQQNQQGYQINQRDLKGQPNPQQFLEKQNIQTYNQKPQNALSYATFIYNPVDSIQRQPQIQQQQIQEVPQQQYQQPQQPRPQIQYQLQHPLLGNYNVPQQLQYQPQIQQQRFDVPQLLNQQRFEVPQLQQQRFEVPQLQQQRFEVPQLQNQQLQFNQLQLQSQQYDVPARTKTYQREAKHDEEYRNILTPLPAPTFPPVQYFGKFAPSILNYQ